MSRPADSIDALLRACDWRVADLARQRAEVVAGRDDVSQLQQRLGTMLTEHSAQRRTLVERASFRSGDMALQRGSARRILDELAATRADLERLDRALQQVDAEIGDVRREKAGLEELVAQRRAAQAALDLSRRQREADDLCAARSPRRK